MSDTRVVPNKFKSREMFSVFKEEDLEGDQPREGAYPVVSMGLRKAQAVLDHIEELKKYVEDNQ